MATTAASASADVLTSTLAAISRASTTDEITASVAAAVRSLADADGATFVLREDDLCFYADEDAVGPLWKGSRFPMSACISGWAMAHREVVVVPDIYADDRIPHDAYRPTFVTSLVMVPVRTQDPIGALGAYWRDSRTPTAAQVRLLEVLADSTAVALENLELRHAVQRRSAERDALSERAGELEAAIHTIAHDLRSPLGAMMGYAELLEDGVAQGQERSFARSIVSSGQRMADQIDRMLSVYRIISRPISPEPVDLTSIGRQLATELGHQARGRSVRVEVEEGLRAEADPVLAHLMLENLLHNAFKYTGKREDARIDVGRVDDDGRFSTFCVRDNGEGFDPGDATRLFRPLSRLHSDTDFPGTGLGLASVARIVELHGGRIRAEGRPQEGAAFYFTLPQAS